MGCPPFRPFADDPLSLETAREAYLWNALRDRWRLDERQSPGNLMRRTATQLDSSGETLCFGDLYVAGRLIFEHEFGWVDGLGVGREPDPGYPGGGRFRRVHEGERGGPDANSCRSCHWRGGQAGAGAVADNAFLKGDGDRVSSAEARNPRPLHGVGVIDALAKEMSDELAMLRDKALVEARRADQPVAIDLQAKGVSFGRLVARADGTVDASAVEGVDSDLRIRPFGWKGTYATLREAVAENFRIHLGIQPSVRDAAGATAGSSSDPDGDGVPSELTEEQLTAVVAYLAAQAVPIVKPQERIEEPKAAAPDLRPPTTKDFLDEWIRGRALFDEVGCASCHTAVLPLNDRWFRTVDSSDRTFALDLSQQMERPRIAYDDTIGGYPIYLFSDLKRHDVGTGDRYLTPPLWGLADSGPWMHDGRAASIESAIRSHGAEAQLARESYEALSFEDAGALRLFLVSLQREMRWFVP